MLYSLDATKVMYFFFLRIMYSFTPKSLLCIKMLETIILMCCSIPKLDNILLGYSINGILASTYILVKALSFYLEK